MIRSPFVDMQFAEPLSLDNQSRIIHY